jgi:hypothetical protein
MSVERHAKATDPDANARRGSVRRMIVSRAGAVLWQLVGFAVGQRKETTRGVEVFHGVGFTAIPSKDGKPEAIVLNVVDAAAPVIVAARDEKTRAAVVPSDLGAGDTCVFGDGAIVVLRSNGTVEIRTPQGAAKRLLTVDDGAALKNAISSAAVVATDGGAALKTNILANLTTWPVGTTVLKAE